jgi:hypothetical protein
MLSPLESLDERCNIPVSYYFFLLSSAHEFAGWQVDRPQAQKLTGSQAATQHILLGTSKDVACKPLAVNISTDFEMCNKRSLCSFFLAGPSMRFPRSGEWAVVPGERESQMRGGACGEESGMRCPRLG